MKVNSAIIHRTPFVFELNFFPSVARCVHRFLIYALRSNLKKGGD